MKNIELTSPLPALARLAGRFRPYAGMLILLLFAGIYGFVILQINALSNPMIDQAEVIVEAQASSVPRIDDRAIQQLQSLKDNSVNVQTLLDQSRDNPFQE